MILQKSLNGQYNGKWILILILANKLKSYNLAEKLSSKPYASLNFNNDNPDHQIQLQKNLGLFLDPKLSFDEHIQCILIKTCKIIGLIRKLQPIIPTTALLTIYKSFLRPHLDYGDVIYDHAFIKSFQSKLESAQCNATLAITGAIIGSSRERLYQELGLDSPPPFPPKILKYWVGVQQGQSYLSLTS